MLLIFVILLQLPLVRRGILGADQRIGPAALLGLTDPRWGGKVPLWFGILKESDLVTGGRQLGPTGGRIVAEVILGLIDKDQSSYFNTPQPWSPAEGDFHIADLLTLVNAW